MKNSVLLENLSSDDLKELIKEGIKCELEAFKKNLNIQDPDELLTREEACKFLQINSSTLWTWTNKGKVTAYGIANRRYYKKAELLQNLKPLNK